MAMTRQELAELLKLLRDNGVTQYSADGITLAMTPKAPAPEPMIPFDENDLVDNDPASPEQRARAKADKLLFRSSQ